MKKSISLAALAAVISSVAPASAGAMTLEEALATAYVTNPTLNAQRAEVRATDESVPQALGGWRPTVTVEGSTGRQIIESSTLRDMGDREVGTSPDSYGVTVQQPLFDGFGTVNAVDAAENQVLAARGQLTAVEQTVLLDASQAYMNVLREMAVLDLNVNNEQVLRRQLEATQDRFEVGEITRTDVSQAESRLAGAVAGRLAAEAELKTARATFARVVGVPPENLNWPEGEMGAGMPDSLAQAIENALEAQPQVIAARYAARAALENVDVARSELLPSVALQASAERSYDSGGHDSFQHRQSIQAVVNVPLYQSGGAWSRLRQAKHTAGQRRIQVDEALQSTRETTVQSWETLQAARAQIESLRAQVEASQVALEGVQREAQVGARTVLDVLDAEQELLNARVNLVRARRDERVAAYQLLSAMGRLTAGSLDLPVTVYDPAEHYDDVRDQWFGSSDAAEMDEAGAPPQPAATGSVAGGSD